MTTFSFYSTRAQAAELDEPARLLATPGKWRKIQDDEERLPLPSRAGSLTAVKLNGGHWLVSFISKDGHHQMSAIEVLLDECGNLNVASAGYGRKIVFGPASNYRRGKKLPIPPAPTLTRYQRREWKDGAYTGGFTIHRVVEVEEWPDPNRAWNYEDALVRPACGDSGGWVQPKDMEPRIDKRHLCGECYPTYECSTDD